LCRNTVSLLKRDNTSIYKMCQRLKVLHLTEPWFSIFLYTSKWRYVTPVLITERGCALLTRCASLWFRDQCCACLMSWTPVNTAPTMVIILYFHMFEKKINLI
jgi:hypothetical protein